MLTNPTARLWLYIRTPDVPRVFRDQEVRGGRPALVQGILCVLACHGRHVCACRAARFDPYRRHPRPPDGRCIGRQGQRRCPSTSATTP